jgi:hypothetical protein
MSKSNVELIFLEPLRGLSNKKTYSIFSCVNWALYGMSGSV